MSDESNKPGWGPVGGTPQSPQFLRQQADNLIKLREMLEGVVAKKQAEVEILREKLIRLKHGGGG